MINETVNTFIEAIVKAYGDKAKLASIETKEYDGNNFRGSICFSGVISFDDFSLRIEPDNSHDGGFDTYLVDKYRITEDIMVVSTLVSQNGGIGYFGKSGGFKDTEEREIRRFYALVRDYFK
jgi:hypothetical protein